MTKKESESSNTVNLPGCAEEKWEMMIRLVQALNTTGDLRDLMQSVTGLLRDWFDCEAIGIRLREGDEYPYFETSGFPASFVEKENLLCSYDSQGQIMRDGVGNPVLECMCGNILCGRFDCSKPFFTVHGSFWSNSTSKLLASTADADRQSRTRNRCNGEGYESVALIPLRTSNQVFGLVQLNDHRPDRFSRERIALLERMADSIALALSQCQLQKALLESEERFRVLFERTPLGYQSLDADGRFIEVNQAWLDMLGYKREEVIGHWFGDFLPSHYVEAFRERFPRFKEAGEVHNEFEMKHKDGSLLLVAFDGKIGYDQNHHFKQTHCILHDITDRKRAEAEKEKLEAQNRQLQKSESLGRMAGAIAHHFNNQLQVVMMNLDFAMRSKSSGEFPTENLTGAMQSARKAAEVSTLMLTYLGQTDATREPLDLSKACLGRLAMLRATIPKGIVLDTDFPALGPVINGNADQIQQILVNLVTNAWEADMNGRGVIRISVKVVSSSDIPAVDRFPIDCKIKSNSYACLEISDEGCGISAQDIEKLFDPFFSRKFTARGLGLSVVLGIVRAHQGVITVESKSGQGSIFRVFLPVSSEAIPQKQVPQKPIPVIQALKETDVGTVLVVDDEITLRKVVTTAIKSMGFKVLEASDGVQAVEVFRQHQNEIRLVLCDMTMPNMDGWQTIEALRKLEPCISVILCSGYSEAQVMAGNHPELPQAFLSKPYEYEELREAIAFAMTK